MNFPLLAVGQRARSLRAAAAAAALAIGYLDLARGGTTVAPVLLVLGYIVLVPMAILDG